MKCEGDMLHFVEILKSLGGEEEIVSNANLQYSETSAGSTVSNSVLSESIDFVVC